jgi:hypothetical protein
MTANFIWSKDWSFVLVNLPHCSEKSHDRRRPRQVQVAYNGEW